MATTLCSRTITHIKRTCRKSTLAQRDYQFWTQHYRLAENVGYLTAYTRNDIDSPIRSDDDTKFVFDLMLKAISTCLHQAVLTTARTMGGSSLGQVQASAAASLESAIDIARLFQSKDLTVATKVSHTDKSARELTILGESIPTLDRLRCPPSSHSPTKRE